MNFPVVSYTRALSGEALEYLKKQCPMKNQVEKSMSHSEYYVEFAN